MSEIPPPPPPPPGGWPPPTGWSAPQGGPPPGWGYPPPGWGPGGAWAQPPGAAAYPGWTVAGPAPLPGSGRFRAQAVGQLLDSAFTLYRRNVWLILALVAVAQVPLALVRYVAYQLTGIGDATTQLQQLTTSGLTPAQETQQFQALLPTFITLFAVVFGILLLQTLVVQPIATAAMTRAVSDRYLDRPASLGSAYSAVLRRLASVVGVAALLVLVFLGLLAAFVVVLLGSSVALGSGAALLLLITVPATVVVALFLYTRWLFASSIVMLEGAGPVAAMRRSWHLVSGATMRIFGITLLVGLITGILSGVLVGLLSVVTRFGDAGLQLILSQLATLVVTVILQPISFIVVVLLYYDQRIRREAFDIEMLAATL